MRWAAACRGCARSLRSGSGAAPSVTLQSDVAPLRRVLLKHPRDAFVDQERVDAQWRALGYTDRPLFDEACREYDAFVSLLERLGVTVEWMPREDLGLDSIYVRDAAVVCDRGAVLGRMGKPARAPEPAALGRALPGIGVAVAAEVSGGGRLEGGDATWLSPASLAVGRGYRTDDAGIAQLAAALPPDVELVAVPLPHHRGPGDVLHLMSLLSPVDEDLLLVHSPLLPVGFRELLLARDFELVEVAAEDFDTLGCNVLAVAPRVVIAVDGNPGTRRRLEAAGVEVHLYEGREISHKGCGGPTCLARTLERGG